MYDVVFIGIIVAITLLVFIIQSLPQLAFLAFSILICFFVFRGYIASNGKWYRHKETPSQYKRRHRRSRR